MLIKAALFDSNGDPVKLMDGPPRQLNVNIPSGGTWREIPDGIEFLDDVPALVDLPAHPELDEDP